MASWSELLKSLNDQDDPGWLDRKLKEHLDAISKQRGDAAVIFYASAFLQKAADNVSITREDINGFMNAQVQWLGSQDPSERSPTSGKRSIRSSGG